MEYEVFAVMSVNIHEFEYWKFVMARSMMSSLTR